ncbi:MAG: C-GCAxxG-C-C family protein [Chloroflexota bacterium]|nr:C-GCAxxG-C-C family protein [Chloroflexota bacterium]
MGNREEIIEKAYEKGYEYEEKYHGCARCTVAALQDSIDFVPKDKDVFQAASCLDGGATPTGEASCGAFTGSGMIIGYLCGMGSERFREERDRSHELIHEVYEKFKEEYGSCLCKDIKKKMEQYEDKCPRVVGKAAAWTAEIILREFDGMVHQ